MHAHACRSLYLRTPVSGCGEVPVYAAPVPVDHESPVPLYRQVAAELRRRIDSEGLRRIPSLVTIGQEYGVSRPTAQGAVRLLLDEELVYIVPGKGTFVRRSGDDQGEE